MMLMLQNTKNHWNEWEDVHEIGEKHNLWVYILKYSCNYLSSGNKAISKLHTELVVWKLASSKIWIFQTFFPWNTLSNKRIS